MSLSPEPLPALPPPSIVHAALAAIRGVQRGVQTIVPPELALSELMLGAARTELVGLAVRLRLAETLGDQPRSADELATACDCHADSLRRALRAMAAMGLFALREDGRFENNRLSRALMEEHPRSLRDAALYFSSESNLRAWRALEHSVRTGEAAFDHANERSVWQWFEAHPDELATFARAMGRATALEAPQLAELYPFDEIQRVCDVGGGSGTLLSEILVRHPHLRGVLCESPGVFAHARALLSQRAVLSRVELAPGSFFDAIPEGCDAYVLKSILHDWDDERSLKILRNVRGAMREGARVALCEVIVEPMDRRPEATLSDMQMLVVCGGRERSLEEFRSLFAQSGFAMGRVFRGALTSVIEGVAR